jgi:hypothetical protein
MHPNPAGGRQQQPTQGRACRRSQGLGLLQDDGAHEVLHAHLAVAVEVGLSDHLLALQRGREGAAVLQARCGGAVGAQASSAVHACVCAQGVQGVQGVRAYQQLGDGVVERAHDLL